LNNTIESNTSIFEQIYNIMIGEEKQKDIDSFAQKQQQQQQQVVSIQNKTIPPIRGQTATRTTRGDQKDKDNDQDDHEYID